MGIGTSLFLIATGAILKYAVTGDVSGVNINTVGVILMVVGILGLLLSLLWMTVWADRSRGTVVRDRAVVRDPDPVVPASARSTRPRSDGRAGESRRGCGALGDRDAQPFGDVTGVDREGGPRRRAPATAAALLAAHAAPVGEAEDRHRVAPPA